MFWNLKAGKQKSIKVSETSALLLETKILVAWSKQSLQNFSHLRHLLFIHHLQRNNDNHLGSGWSSAVEHMPHNLEVVSSNTPVYWAFSIPLFSLVLLPWIMSLVEVLQYLLSSHKYLANCAAWAKTTTSISWNTLLCLFSGQRSVVWLNPTNLSSNTVDYLLRKCEKAKKSFGTGFNDSHLHWL